MLYNNVILRVNDVADVEKVRVLLRECAELSLTEPGCDRFEVYNSEDEPRLFFLIERWRTQEELDKHREAFAFQNIYVPKILSKAVRVPHPSKRVA